MIVKKSKEVEVKEPEKENELPAEEISTALVQSMNGIEPRELKGQIEATQKSFELIGQFIKANLRENVDYGMIAFHAKNCPHRGDPVYATKLGPKCQAPFCKMSKPFLHKPGSEKFTILFGHRPTFQWINQDFVKGIFAVKCYILNKKKDTVGEGFGSARVGERPTWTENEAMKMACKRAQIDAALRTYGLSEHFTQDEEVMTRKPSVSTPAANYRPSAPVQRTGQFQMREDGSPITQAQMNMLFGSIERIGHDKKWLENWIYTQLGVQGVENLTKFQASKFIDVILQQEKKQGSFVKKTFPTARPAEEVPTIEYEEEPVDQMPEETPKDVVEEMKKEVEEFDNSDQPFADL